VVDLRSASLSAGLADLLVGGAGALGIRVTSAALVIVAAGVAASAVVALSSLSGVALRVLRSL
jgi:hypothetical protein